MHGAGTVAVSPAAAAGTASCLQGGAALYLLTSSPAWAHVAFRLQPACSKLGAHHFNQPQHCIAMVLCNPVCAACGACVLQDLLRFRRNPGVHLGQCTEELLLQKGTSTLEVLAQAGAN